MPVILPKKVIVVASLGTPRDSRATSELGNVPNDIPGGITTYCAGLPMCAANRSSRTCAPTLTILKLLFASIRSM